MSSMWDQFNRGLEDVVSLAATPEDVDLLESEDAQLAFVKEFRNLIRTLNKLRPFTDFSWPDLGINEQTFEDYKSKYLDIYDRSHEKEPGASILEELDFELELIHRDEVNVAYILEMLGQLQLKKGKRGDSPDTQKAMQEIMGLLGKEVQLRSKRELIEKFISDYMPNLAPEQDLQEMFVGYWNNEKRVAIHQLCEREGMDKDGVYRILDEYSFTGKEPLREQVFSVMTYRPKLMERKKIYRRVTTDLKGIVEKYEDDTGSIGIEEDPAEYESKSLDELGHKVGDVQIYFTDELQLSRHVLELARFSIKLDSPYVQGIAELNAYQVGGELFGRGIINEGILTEYLRLTGEFQNTIDEYDFDFDRSTQTEQGVLLWSFSESREGSTILDFVLSVWGYSVAIGGPVVAFLAAYPKAADGLERLKQDVNHRFLKDEAESPIILGKQVREVLRKRNEKN